MVEEVDEKGGRNYEDIEEFDDDHEDDNYDYEHVEYKPNKMFTMYLITTSI